MAERSRTRADGFWRRRLIVGVLLVTLIGGGAMYGLSKLRRPPDPGRLVYAAREGVFVHDLETGSDRRLKELPDDVELAVPSPDGRFVAYVLGAGELWMLPIEGERDAFQIAERFTIPLGWSPDGRLVAGELLGDRDLVAVDPEGKRDTLLSGGYAAGNIPVWIDTDRFAIAGDPKRFVIVDGAEEGEPIDGNPIAASPDGAQMLITRKGRVYVADVDDRALTNEQELFRGKVSAGAVSPAGFAAIATKDGVRVFEGGTRSRLVVDRAVDWVGWARAGAVVLYAHDGAAYALELPTGSATGGPLTGSAEGGPLTGSAEGGPLNGKPRRITSTKADVFPLLAFAVVP